MDYTKMIMDFTDEDYDIIQEYHKMEICIEVIYLNLFYDRGSIVPTHNNGNIYFYNKQQDFIIPFYKAVKSNNGFKLFELTYKKYCEMGF